MFNETATCASYDEKKILRIWDMRTYATLQTISLEFIPSIIKFLCVLPDDSFILGGKSIYFFHNEELKKQLMLIDESLPLDVEFNDYFKNFFILTKYDVRVFNSVTGQIEKAFADLVKPVQSHMPRITAFCQGAQSRKFYVGDSQGNIKMLNAKNGQVMKQVNDINNDYAQVQKMAQITFHKLGEHLDHEVLQLLYLQEEKVLIAGINSIIFLYDEIDSENSKLLRFFMGGHDEGEISALAYCQEWSLLASGSSNGIVSIWDLNAAKHTAVLYGHKDRIVKLEFLMPFAGLVSSSVDGHLCLWEIGPTYETKYQLIARFVVPDYQGDQRLNSLCRIACMRVWIKDCSNAETVIGPHWAHKKSAELNAELIPEAVIQSICDVFKLQNKKLDGTNVKNKLKTSDFSGLFETAFKREVSNQHVFVMVASETGILYIADIMPYLGFVKLPRLFRVSRNQQDKLDSKLRRNENLSVHKSVVLGIAAEIKKMQSLTEVYDLSRTLTISQCIAHQGRITGICPIELTNFFATCGQDQKIKLWNLQGKLDSQASLLTVESKEWRFKFDWVTVVTKDLEFALDMLEIIESRRYSREQRDEIIYQHLVEHYIKKPLEVTRKPKIKAIGALTERLLSESIKKTMVDKIKESSKPVSKQQILHLQKMADTDMDRALTKSIQYRNNMLRNPSISGLAAKLAAEFNRMSKDEEEKIVSKNFSQISNLIMTQMRKPRFSKHLTVIPGSPTSKRNQAFDFSENKPALLTSVSKVISKIGRTPSPDRLVRQGSTENRRTLSTGINLMKLEIAEDEQNTVNTNLTNHQSNFGGRSLFASSRHPGRASNLNVEDAQSGVESMVKVENNQAPVLITPSSQSNNSYFIKPGSTFARDRKSTLKSVAFGEASLNNQKPKDQASSKKTPFRLSSFAPNNNSRSSKVEPISEDRKDNKLNESITKANLMRSGNPLSRVHDKAHAYKSGLNMFKTRISVKPVEDSEDAFLKPLATTPKKEITLADPFAKQTQATVKNTRLATMIQDLVKKKNSTIKARKPSQGSSRGTQSHRELPLGEFQKLMLQSEFKSRRGSVAVEETSFEETTLNVPGAKRKNNVLDDMVKTGTLKAKHYNKSVKLIEGQSKFLTELFKEYSNIHNPIGLNVVTQNGKSQVIRRALRETRGKVQEPAPAEEPMTERSSFKIRQSTVSGRHKSTTSLAISMKSHNY